MSYIRCHRSCSDAMFVREEKILALPLWTITHPRQADIFHIYQGQIINSSAVSFTGKRMFSLLTMNVGFPVQPVPLT